MRTGVSATSHEHERRKKIMRIINARDGKSQPIPFSLGEAGRGRWLEEIKVSNRPGQEPASPEDVGYFVFGEKAKHVILTKGGHEQRGILLRINTLGCYTRGTSGSVVHKGGDAKLLATGSYAFGDAGRIGGGTDELWHVESPSVFVVNICGGSHKGYGHRYLIVTKSFRTVMIKRTDLCQMIATDDDPEVAEVAKQFAEVLHEDVRSAIALAAQLEVAMDDPVVQSPVTHFATHRPIEDIVRDFGIAIPAAMGEKIGGVSGVQAGTLVPGEKLLVNFGMGPGGGKRYRFEKISEAGITCLEVRSERPYTNAGVLALVESPNWHSAWVNYKDGEVTSYVLTDAGGVHHLSSEGRLSTTAWQGVAPVTPPPAWVAEVFGLPVSMCAATAPKLAPAVVQVAQEEEEEVVIDDTPPVPAPASALTALAGKFSKK